MRLSFATILLFLTNRIPDSCYYVFVSNERNMDYELQGLKSGVLTPRLDSLVQNSYCVAGSSHSVPE